VKFSKKLQYSNNSLQVKSAEAEAEAKYLSGVGVAKQRKAIVDGLRTSIVVCNIISWGICLNFFAPNALPNHVISLLLSGFQRWSQGGIIEGRDGSSFAHAILRLHKGGGQWEELQDNVCAKRLDGGGWH
jgi:hypothetical protein